MFEANVPIGDLLYVLFGFVSATVAVITVGLTTRRHSHSEHERIVRIDENMKGLRDDVQDIKSELRNATITLNDHERRITRLEVVSDHDGGTTSE